MGEPGTLLEEVNNAGEANTLHSLDLQSGDILFFESGPVPLANTIILKVSVCLCDFTSFVVSL
jgi:hypothetical protein